MKKFKFRLGQKVIYNGEETKIIAKTYRGGYVIEYEDGWNVCPVTMDTQTILKGTPMDGSIHGWNVNEQDLTEVSK